MAVKVGDKVRYTGSRKYDLTSGRVYDVVRVDEGYVVVVDDAGYNNAISEFEPITENDNDTNYAEQAARHGILITLEIGDYVLTFDGRR